MDAVNQSRRLVGQAEPHSDEINAKRSTQMLQRCPVSSIDGDIGLAFLVTRGCLPRSRDLFWLSSYVTILSQSQSVLDIFDMDERKVGANKHSKVPNKLGTSVPRNVSFARCSWYAWNLLD